MATKIATLPSIYQAYSGPDVGGFNLLPQSTVPDLGADQYMLGDQNTPPHPLVGLYGAAGASRGGPTKIGSLDQLMAAVEAPAAPGPALATGPLVNQTMVPKGGVPQQLTKSQADAFANVDRLQRIEQARAYDRGQGGNFFSNMLISAAKQHANNLLALPSLAVDAFGLPARVAMGGPAFPTPRLTVDKLAAGIRGGQALLQGQDPSQAYNQALQNIDVAESARVAEHPWATGVGSVGGDVASIASLRVPAADAVVSATKSPATLRLESKLVEMLPPSYTRALLRYWKSPAATSVRRGLGKAAETGLEGATLALLHEGDPVKTGTYAASGQIAGSLALGAIKHPYKSMGAIAAAAIGWQMLKDVIPGGRDSIIESGEHATQIAAGGTILGGLAGILGAGRFRGSDFMHLPLHNWAQDLPQFAEGVNAAMRTIPNSLWANYLDPKNKDKYSGVGTVMDNLSSDVSSFTPPELKRLGRAILDGKLTSTVREMLGNEDFASRMGQQ